MVTTAIGHTLMVTSLKHFSVTTASIISSLQPVYGIIMAFLFLSEILNKYILLLLHDYLILNMRCCWLLESLLLDESVV